MMSQIQAVRYDKKTVKFDEKEEKYWMHFLSKDPIVGSFIQQQMRLNPKYYQDILNQPICEKCEKFAFHNKNGLQCTSCGHWSPTKTHKVKEHIKSGLYK